MLSITHPESVISKITKKNENNSISDLCSSPLSEAEGVSRDYVHRVLMVDDEPTLLEISSLFLTKMGNIFVVCSGSADDALTLLTTEKFDAIVSDYDMPGMNGIEFLTHLRKTGNKLPFILFTGRGREEVVIEALNRGASYYIRKDGTPAVLFAELAHIIHQAVIKRHYEEKIRESEQLIHSIFHHLPDAAYAIDTKGTVLAWNHGMEEITGVHADLVVGKKQYLQFIPFYSPRNVTVADILIRSGVIAPDSWTILEEREGMIIVEVTCTDPVLPIIYRITATHVYDPDGKIIGAIESIRDISLEKKTQQDLAEVNNYHRTVIESHIDPLVTLTPELIICDVNVATEKIIGYSRIDLIGTDFFKWVLEPEKTRTVCNEMMNGKHHVTGYPFVLKCKDIYQEVFLFATSYSNHDGKIAKIFAEFHETLPSILNT